jgi:hypothetical protein
MVCCGMAVRRSECEEGVTVKMERVTLIGKGR